MKTLLLFTAIIVYIGIPAVDLQAQIELSPSIISASGGYGENENFSISWTLGELAVNTLHGENSILTQGFHQPVTFGVGILKNEIEWNITVYPNPVHNELYIQFDLEDSKDFMLEIQDVTGRILRQESHEHVNPGDLVIINTSDLVSGVYFLRILTSDFRQVKATSLRKL